MNVDFQNQIQECISPIFILATMRLPITRALKLPVLFLLLSTPMTKPLKMRTISLYKTNHFASGFFSAYSKFKHGSKTQARMFGKNVAEVCFFDNDQTLVFYSAPH